MAYSGISVPKSWRSEWPLIGLFALSGVFCLMMSWWIPASIITGEVIRLSPNFVLYLSLPLFWLMPFFFGIFLIYRIFNVRFILTDISVEARYGVLSLRQNINKLRYEDIRSLEVTQSVIGRMLGFGNVEIGTSGTSGVEVRLLGVIAPREVLEMVQLERDRRQARKGSTLKEHDPLEATKAIGTI